MTSTAEETRGFHREALRHAKNQFSDVTVDFAYGLKQDQYVLKVYRLGKFIVEAYNEAPSFSQIAQDVSRMRSELLDLEREEV